MEKKGSIRKDLQLRPSQDFQVLMDQGMKYVQDFSGDIWTDYNAHDPGVTILEQFCYGLTELGYKAAFPIEDILVESLDGTIDGQKNSFYTPALVFSSHPFTVSDFRKLLIDRFSEIQNCWLIPAYPAGRENGINGVYQVEVLPSLAFQKELRKKPELSKVFLDKLRHFLEKNRNLGEDFEPPQLLTPCWIWLQANVEISAEADPDQVMAEILFALEVFFYHPVSYTNLEELQKEEKRLEEIFSGPRLNGGFIPDTELKARSKIVYTEKFQQLISKISGVTKAWNLALDRDGKAKSFGLPHGCYASINTDPKDPESIFSTLNISVNGNSQRLDKSKVADLLLDLWSKKYRVYEEDLFKQGFWQDQLKGRYRNAGKYDSIQHHFPGIYGLGKEGLSSREPLERQAKVKQLKGYLLLMEKHLANFLAQLAHIPDFFDSDVDSHEGTYFSQNPSSKIGDTELENPSNLLPGFNASGINPQTGESRLSWLKRKNRVLDHLLARFGEQIQEMPSQLSLKLNLLGNEEEMLAELLRNKSRFLRLIPELNYGKHQAYFPDPAGGEAISTVEKLLRLIVGIEQQPESLVPTFLAKNVSDQPIEETPSFLKSQSSFAELFLKFRPLSKRERNFPQIQKPSRAVSSFGKVGIRELFARAVDPDSYWISREPSRVGTIEILLQKSESNWVSIWEGTHEEDAIAAVAKNIQYFRAMNTSSEGMYLVDHILLRPILEDSEFGFVLLDEWGKPTFRSPWTPIASERKAILEKFYKASLNPKAYRADGNSLVLRDDEGAILGSYVDYKPLDLHQIVESTATLSMLMSGSSEVSGLLALQEIESLRYIGTLHSKGVYQQRAVVLLRRLPDGSEIREDFFDLKATMILPDWPARFQESHFNYFLSNEIKDRVPAHMEVEVHWLNLREFQAFEPIYKNWKEVRAGAASKKQFNAGAFRLYEFLTGLEGGEDD